MALFLGAGQEISRQSHKGYTWDSRLSSVPRLVINIGESYVDVVTGPPTSDDFKLLSVPGD
jgi:hypothetical protein